MLSFSIIWACSVCGSHFMLVQFSAQSIAARSMLIYLNHTANGLHSIFLKLIKKQNPNKIKSHLHLSIHASLDNSVIITPYIQDRFKPRLTQNFCSVILNMRVLCREMAIPFCTEQCSLCLNYNHWPPTLVHHGIVSVHKIIILFC